MTDDPQRSKAFEDSGCVDGRGARLVGGLVTQA